MQRIIGGEFDIDISCVANTVSFANRSLYSSGRAALYNILKHIEEKGTRTTLMLPDYLCESILDAVREFDFKILFYSLNKDLSIDEHDFNSKYVHSSAVLLINYFGCMDCKNQIAYIRDKDSNALIIQDNVQGFYAMYQNTDADYYFTSFRKSFAVPDGAWAISASSELPQVKDKNTFAEYKIAAGILKHLSTNGGIEDQQYLDLFSRGENYINDNYTSTISNLTLNLMPAFDISAIAEIRKKNSAYIIKGLKKLGIEPIVKPSEDQVPLFVPLRIENRNEVRSALFAENIFCPVHWPMPHGYDLARGKELAHMELSLIIDQRYDENDMARILKVLEKSMK